jgi:hypothetical protein
MSPFHCHPQSSRRPRLREMSQITKNKRKPSDRRGGGGEKEGVIEAWERSLKEKNMYCQIKWRLESYNERFRT